MPVQLQSGTACTWGLRTSAYLTFMPIHHHSCLAMLQSEVAWSALSKLMHMRGCRDEEVSFGRTLAKGNERFKKALAATSGTLLSGKDAFELYDTFGFPADLTQVQTPDHQWF